MLKMITSETEKLWCLNKSELTFRIIRPFKQQVFIKSFKIQKEIIFLIFSLPTFFFAEKFIFPEGKSVILGNLPPKTEELAAM